MSEDKPPRAVLGDPEGADNDILLRAAGEIRASKSLEAFVPLSASERERLADAAIERTLGAAGAEPSGVPVGIPVESGAAVAAITAARRSRFGARSAAIVVGSTVALAAAVALYVGTRRSVEPLAAYTMVVEGEQHARGSAEPAGSAGEPVPVRPETRLVITLAAETRERDALLRLVLVRGGRATLLDPPTTRRAGTLVLEGRAAELFGTQSDGPAELVVVLGRELPGDDDVRALALGASGDVPRPLQVIRRAVVLEGFSHSAIDVLLGGCSAVLGPRAPGEVPTCEVATGARIQLWIGVPATAAVAIALDGRPLEPSAQARGGGAAFELDVAARTGVLSVRVADRSISAWRIAPAASFEKVRAADAALGARKLDEAAAILDTIGAGASPEERLEALRRRATIAFSRGELARERERREQAVALASSLGRTSTEIDQTVAILYGLRNQHALAQAVQLLPALDAHGMLYAEGAVRRDWVHGLFASELGDLGAALRSFQRALALADRIGDAVDRAAILAPLADVLQSLGRDGEVRVLVDAELQRAEHSASVCTRVEALTSAGWLLRDSDPPRAQWLVDQAAALAVEGCERRVPIALVNQGWLLAAARRFRDARGVLDRLAALPRPRDARVTTWVLRLEAEIFLGEDPARAAQHAQHLAARAAALCSTELAYEAHLLAARALVLLDRPDQAATAFADAERALALWSRLVPLGEGRNTFFQRHDQLALTAIAFLVERARRGEPGARVALATTVRHSLARFVASLAGAGRERARAERGETARDRTSQQFERTLDRWPASLAATERGTAVTGVCEVRDAAARGQPPALVEPPAHAALLVHPAPHALLVVAWRGSSIEIEEIPRGVHEPRDELSARIAKVAAPMLAGAPRVQLHIHRSLAALPLDRSLGALLGVPIAFAVDAPRRPAPACRGDRRALLVSNPQHNLWAASDTARLVEADLTRRGLRVDRLDGAAATRAAIEAGLADPCTAVFHYDGHGAAGYGGPAGAMPDRTDDALVLAGGDLLTAADVLALPHVPDRVVLNGCTTAAPEGLGLAQAFLLAGAAQVIASLDELTAADAASFTRALFAGAPLDAIGLDLVTLFARAMAGADVPALRVFER